MSSTTLRVETTSVTGKPSVLPETVLPAPFGAALALSIILPLLNFLRTPPLGDFYGEWSSIVALTLAVLSVAPRLGGRTNVSLSAFSMPGLIVVAVLIQVSLGKYSYAADWLFWISYLTVALLAILLGQVMSGRELRHEMASRIAWALVIAAVANFVIQLAQSARMDVEWWPFVVYRAEGSMCQLFGNVGQTNHANTLAWLGVAGSLYLYSVNRVGPRGMAVLLATLLLSSSLTVSRMGWLFLIASAVLLLSRRLWPNLRAQTPVFLIASLIVGFAFANWATDFVRANVDPACVSGIDRLVDTKEAGSQIRPLLWIQAVEVWQSSPWIGTGAGSFIGSVYRANGGKGAQPLDSWAHNTPLQFLAEFGLIVVIGILAIALIWISKLIRHSAKLSSEDGFFLTGLAIIGIHSMLEYPLWYIHFLIITCLFIGLMIRPTWSYAGVSIPARAALTVMALTIAAGCITIFIDYRKLDRLQWVSDFAQGLGTERVPELQVTLEEAATQVKFFSQPRDYYLAIGRPVDKENLDSKIATVDRAMGRMPNINLVHLRILLAILDDDPSTARQHMRLAFKFHAQHTDAVVNSIRARIAERPDEFSALGPMLDEELAHRPQRRW